MIKLLIVLLAFSTNVYSQLTFSTEGKSIATYNETASKFNENTYYDDNSLFWFNEDYTIMYQKGDASSVLILTSALKKEKEGLFTFYTVDEKLLDIFVIIDYNQDLIKLMFDNKGITYLITYSVTNVIDK